MRVIWMIVTPDKYELPLATADSLSGLAATGWGAGMSRAAILNAIRWRRKGYNSGRRFIRVEVDDEDDE